MATKQLANHILLSVNHSGRNTKARDFVRGKYFPFVDYRLRGIIIDQRKVPMSYIVLGHTPLVALTAFLLRYLFAF